MKRSILVLCLLLIAAPQYAAEHSATADPSAGAAEQEFPKPSKSQDRRPLQVAAADEGDVICGYHPSMPNCDFRCRNGVPVLNSDGTQRVICWSTPIYPDPSGGVCSRYYDCGYMVPGQVCTWSGNPYTACTFLEGNALCSTCSWN